MNLRQAYRWGVVICTVGTVDAENTRGAGSFDIKMIRYLSGSNGRLPNQLQPWASSSGSHRQWEPKDRNGSGSSALPSSTTVLFAKTFAFVLSRGSACSFHMFLVVAQCAFDQACMPPGRPHWNSYASSYTVVLVLWTIWVGLFFNKPFGCLPREACRGPIT